MLVSVSHALHTLQRLISASVHILHRRSLNNNYLVVCDLAQLSARTAAEVIFRAQPPHWCGNVRPSAEVVMECPPQRPILHDWWR